MATSDVWRVLFTVICLLFIGRVTSWLRSPDWFYDAVSVNDVGVINKHKNLFTCAKHTYTRICKRVWSLRQLQSLSLWHTGSHCCTNGTTLAKMNATNESCLAGICVTQSNSALYTRCSAPTSKTSTNLEVCSCAFALAQYGTHYFL